MLLYCARLGLAVRMRDLRAVAAQVVIRRHGARGAAHVAARGAQPPEAVVHFRDAMISVLLPLSRCAAGAVQPKSRCRQATSLRSRI
jgi:hypothetical protein